MFACVLVSLDVVQVGLPSVPAVVPCASGTPVFASPALFSCVPRLRFAFCDFVVCASVNQCALEADSTDLVS